MSEFFVCPMCGKGTLDATPHGDRPCPLKVRAEEAGITGREEANRSYIEANRSTVEANQATRDATMRGSLASLDTSEVAQALKALIAKMGGGPA